MSQTLQTPSHLAEAIRHVAEHAGTSEMELQVEVEKLLDPFLAQLPVRSRFGHSTKLGGIKDALHGNVIIEYEHPGKLSKQAGLDENIEQLQRYLVEEATHHGHQATAQLRRMVGVGLDGDQILFVRYRGRPLAAAVPRAKPRGQLAIFPEVELGDFSVDGPHPVSAESIDIFLGFLQSLARPTLTPEALAETFGPKSETAKAVVGLFYNKLLKTKNRRVETFFAEWQRIFGIVYGQDIGKAEADARALGKQFGVKTVPKLKELLFAVHTYFALLMKLLAAELMTLQRGSMLQSFITPLVSVSSHEFRKALKDLEDGGLFARQGINNFLEGDFFAWYLSEWDKAMAGELRGLTKALAAFDPRTPFFLPEQSRDLLKKLYQYLVPKKLRHDLGEFYTPDWLAEHLLNQLEYDGNLDKRLLDPACGSGTFLVLAIRRMKEWAEQHDPPIDAKVVAEKILANLCGFDLNPIAVIAARTNLLLALGELVRYLRPIEIPIYMCDSVLTPSQHRAQRAMLRPGYDVPTRAGTFVIPREFVDGGHVDRLAAVLEEAIRDKLPARDFVNRVRREVGITQTETEALLRHLHADILKLENDDRNRIWARFIKNSFAPVFKSEPSFDYVAGNPPWVNWQSLSDEYKNASRELWKDYGFFTQKGYRALVPAGTLDLAALFAYVALDAYVGSGGRLGFVVTQSLFQSRGAGEGFRRFTLPGDVKLGVGQLHDFVDLKPFEGAQNRTATVVLHKGGETRYPVAYTVWRPRGDYLELRRVKRFEPDLDEVEAATQRLHVAATPVDSTRLESPWMISSLSLLATLRKLTGTSLYRARVGIHTFGANSIYWLRVKETLVGGNLLVENVTEGAKKKVRREAHQIEAGLVYPLLRGRDVTRWHANPSIHILVTHSPASPKVAYDESELRVRFPKAYAYLTQFRSVLVRRGIARKLGYDWFALGKMGPYVFAPYRVVWREQANQLTVAVVGSSHTPWGKRSVLADHKLSVTPFDSLQEAHYVCACLASSPARVLVSAYVVSTQISTHLFDNLSIPQFTPDSRIHAALARFSQRAHELAARMAENPVDWDAKRQLEEVENEIDHAAAQLWGLSDAELDEIKKALELLS